jgi:hypothetical protein
MNIVFPDRAIEGVKHAPLNVQRAFEKAVVVSGGQSPAPLAAGQEV